MTGAVMPEGADTVVIQEVVKKEGDRITVPPGQKKAQNVRYAGEDSQGGQPVLRTGKLLTAADIGLIASLGIGEVKVKRRLRVAFFATGDELASIGAPLKEGEVYDSNRYTLHGMLRGSAWSSSTWVLYATRRMPWRSFSSSVGTSRRGDHDRRSLRRGSRFRPPADGEAGRGAVLEDRHAPRPADGVRQDRQCVPLRPAGKSGRGDGHLLPVRARRAALHVGREAPRCRCSRRAAAENLRKVPGRTEYQRGSCSKERGAWKVRTTGQQGSGVLRSMSEANCFIVLEHERGSVKRASRSTCSSSKAARLTLVVLSSLALKGVLEKSRAQFERSLGRGSSFTSMLRRRSCRGLPPGSVPISSS